MLYVPVTSWLNSSGLCNSTILEKWWNKTLEARKCSLTLPLPSLVLSGSPMETSIYPDLPSTWVSHLGYSHKTRKAFGWLQTELTSQLELDGGGVPRVRSTSPRLSHVPTSAKPSEVAASYAAVLGSFVLQHRLTNRVPVSKEHTLENLCRSFWYFYSSVLVSSFSWWLARGGEGGWREYENIQTFFLGSVCLSSSPYRHCEWGVLRHQLGFIIIITAVITFALRSHHWHWRCRGTVCLRKALSDRKLFLTIQLWSICVRNWRFGHPCSCRESCLPFVMVVGLYATQCRDKEKGVREQN